MRQFREAERVFTAALGDAREHVRLRLAQGAPLREQQRWAAVVSTRIQGSGIGWILLQEGRLREAESALLQAALQLESTGEESLKLFHRSLIAIATRRQLPPSIHHRKYQGSMHELSECAAEYHRIGDLAGELRCRQELCRGFLDLAEFGNDGCASLKAASMLRMMDALAAQAADRRWMLRCDVLRGRLLLTPLTVRRTRPRSSPDLRTIADLIERHWQQEPRNGDLFVMRGLIAWVHDKDALARELLKKAGDVAGACDPVLNREAALLQAWCVATSIQSGKIETDADEKLPDTFLKYCVQPFAAVRSNEVSFAPRDVENAYLTILARRVQDLVSEVNNGLFGRRDTHLFPVRMDTDRRPILRLNLLARLEPNGGETIH